MKRALLSVRGDSGIGVRILVRRSAEQAPLLYIDRVKSPQSARKTLDPKAIESVNVIKGAAAARYTNDPDAANGVIFVRTKKAIARP